MGAFCNAIGMYGVAIGLRYSYDLMSDKYTTTARFYFQAMLYNVHYQKLLFIILVTFYSFLMFKFDIFYLLHDRNPNTI